MANVQSGNARVDDSSQWGLDDRDTERALAVLLMYWLCSVPVGAPAVAGTDSAADVIVTAMQSASVPACHSSRILLRGSLQPLC